MIQRRTLLATLAMPYILRPMSAFASDVDCVIVGAGAAGLSAAKAMLAAGLKVQVIEARDRLGGRLYAPRGYDAGAAYIHFADQNPWVKIAEDQNIELKSMFFGGGTRFSLFENGKPASVLRLPNLLLAAAKMRSAINDFEGYDRSMKSLAYDEKTLNAISSTANFALGEEPQHVSLNDYNSLHGGGNMSITGSYGALFQNYATGFEASLNTIASKIEDNGGFCEVTTNKGVIRTKSVIVTVPIGVLQSGTINLPKTQSYLKALEGFKMGALTKIAIKTSGKLHDFEDYKFIRDTYNNVRITFEFFPQEQPYIVAVVGGDHARALIKSGENAAVSHVLDRLKAMFGEKITPLLQEGHLHGWAGEPFSQGSYAIVKPTYLKARDQIREPLTEKIYLAGEATAGPASMTVGGATLEGKRVADILISKLK